MKQKMQGADSKRMSFFDSSNDPKLRLVYGLGKKTSKMTDYKVETLKTGMRQVEFETAIYTETVNIDEIKAMFEELCGMALESKEFDGKADPDIKRVTKIWTVEISPNAPPKHRLRMENEDLIQSKFLSRYSKMQLGSDLYYPCFRFSVQQSSDLAKRVANVVSRVKYANCMFYFSPNKICGRYNGVNTQTHLVIINLHFYRNERKIAKASFEEQMKKVFDHVFSMECQSFLQKALRVELPVNPRMFKYNSSDISSKQFCCFYKGRESLISLGLDPNRYTLRISEKTRELMKDDSKELVKNDDEPQLKTKPDNGWSVVKKR